MPSSQNVRAETSQEVAVTQDLVLSSSLQDEAKFERVAAPKETRGLHILFEPTTASSDLAIDIVAVHGLAGDSYSTWTDENNGKLWLRDLLPESLGFGNARVMTFGYDHSEWLKQVDSWEENKKSSDVLLDHIVRTRIDTNTPKGKPIMFVGHSLGGIIIKKALDLARQIGFRDIFDATKSIFFFGTPCIGREERVHECLLTVQRIFEATGVMQDEALEAMKECAYMIFDASQYWPDLSGRLLVTSFYECEKYNGVLVVNENRARGNFANETTIGLDANHHTICHFASENDKGFAEVHREMYMHLIQISKALDAKGHTPTENKRATLDDLEATTKPL
ncbi:hypothetical protein AA0116_g5158 [Alternaria tenuissima]|nr:hypothetical protein AA0116_g5158 [Alternaria tenuissima]